MPAARARALTRAVSGALCMSLSRVYNLTMLFTLLTTRRVFAPGFGETDGRSQPRKCAPLRGGGG